MSFVALGTSCWADTIRAFAACSTGALNWGDRGPAEGASPGWAETRGFRPRGARSRGQCLPRESTRPRPYSGRGPPPKKGLIHQGDNCVSRSQQISERRLIFSHDTTNRIEFT